MFLVGIAAAVLQSGCALSYKQYHRSPLLEVYVAGQDHGEVQRGVPVYEDAVVLLADEYGVPLQEIIPVRVYIEGDTQSGRSYYNRLTRSIVLRGSSDPAIFVHELSHLLAHRLVGTPPYWADEALASYMEARFSLPPGENLSLLALDRARYFLEENVAWETRYLAHCVAGAWDSSEVLEHLTARAVDEDRSWGLMVARYFFEWRWADRPTQEKISGLLELSREEVDACASEILEFCRRPENLSGKITSPTL